MNQGFTLIELLVVVLVIGILSAVALPQYQTAVERARATEALTQMSAVRGAMERYHSQHEAWPTANNFSALDVDIPEISSGVYGGKNFKITFNNDSSGDGYITAERTTNKTDNKYFLHTKIEPQDNGTYLATRSCTCSAGENPCTPGNNNASYCNAISGGNPDNF